ncbi:hypothetical protein ACZ90_31590 [Streptomyces albus subsp. albus]|nr:hypothetical protein ACZ90_31590 [Streptomyces albus subsp. albus]
MRRARMPYAPLLRERQSPSSSPSPDGPDDHDPFAPPPEGAPDQPWSPRPYPMPGNASGGEGQGQGSGGQGDGSGGQGQAPGWSQGQGWPGQAPGHGQGWGQGQGQGQGWGGQGWGGQSPGGQDGQNGQNGSGDQGQGADGQQPPQPPAWGSQWSSRQPGRQGGGFGQGPGDRPNGPNGQRGGPGARRWDPSDPAQRRARYALLAGMWAFFFALFSLPEIALLLGALAVYWGISSLRGKPRRPEPTPSAAALDAPPPAPDAPRTQLPAPRGFTPRPQATAAISGLVAGGIALVIVVATFSFQLIYRDYYSCVDDALTQQSRQSCEHKLPHELRPLLSSDD